MRYLGEWFNLPASMSSFSWASVRMAVRYIQQAVQVEASTGLSWRTLALDSLAPAFSMAFLNISVMERRNKK